MKYIIRADIDSANKVGMLIFHQNPTFETDENTATMLPKSPPRSNEYTGLMLPKSPPRSNEDTGPMLPKSPPQSNADTGILLPKSPPRSNEDTGLMLPKSPPRSNQSQSQATDGPNSPPSVIFSWSRMRRAENEDEDDDDSGAVSPPLWRPGSSTYLPNSSYYHPMSLRAQEIARGRQELMKLYEGMPESAYELSLKDLVDQKAAMEQMNSDGSLTRKDTDNNLKKKRASREHTRRKGNYPKSFLLNMFVPSSLTVRSHPPTSRVVRQGSDRSRKVSPKVVVRKEHPIAHLLSLLRIWPSKKSEVSPSTSFSRVSPRPYFGKDGQAEKPFIDSPNGSKSNSSNRCSICSVYTVYFKMQCEACDKIYCSNCVKSAIVNTPEGPKCRATCALGSNSDRESETKIGCWPSLSAKRVKPGRKIKHSSSEE